MSLKTQEARKNLRVDDSTPIQWRIKDGYASGQGRIRNISTSGMLLETNNSFEPTAQSMFAFEPANGTPFEAVPQEGRLVWSKKKGWIRNRTLCGIEFVEPKEESVTQLHEKIQKGILKVASARRTRIVIGTFLMTVMMGLLIFSVNQFRENYVTLQASHEEISKAFEGQLSLSQYYAAELTVTKQQLAEAQQLLTQAREENTNLQNLVGELNQKTIEFEQTIAKLKDENANLSTEMVSLKDRLRLFEGDVKDMAEAKAVIALFKEKLRVVKGKIKQFKREAYEAKVSIQKERDRIETLMGNTGFLVKDGSANKPTEQAIQEAQKALEAQQAQQAAAAGQGGRVEVNVQFVK